MAAKRSAAQRAASKRNLEKARAAKKVKGSELVTLYHRTKPQAARKILLEQKFRSDFHKSVYFSTEKNGIARSYGSGVVSVKVRRSLIHPDPISPSSLGSRKPGEKLVKVSMKRLEGVRISHA